MPDNIIDLAVARIPHDANRLEQQNPRTFAGAWAYFEAGRFKELRPPSKLAYQAVMKAAIAALPGEARAEAIANWLVSLEIDQGRARATRNKYHKIIRAVAEYASIYTGNSTLYNEIRKVRQAPQKAKRRKYPPDELVRFMEETAAENTAEKAWVRVLAYAGVREGEALALRCSDVTEFMGKVLLCVENTRDKFGLRPRKNAMNGKMHQPTLDAKTAALVLELRAMNGEWLFPWAVTYPDSMLERWRRRHPCIRDWFTTELGWHCLRHWGATKLASVPSVSITDLQAWLGNNTISASLCYMGQVRGTTQSGDGSKIAELMSATTGPPHAAKEGAGTGARTPMPVRTKFDPSCIQNRSSKRRPK